MSMRWKRWTAALLLLLAVATVSASVSAVVCPLGSHAAAESPAGSAHDAERGTASCPLQPLADAAATPAVLSFVESPAVVPPAYVRALSSTRCYGIDPEPPVKPPSA